MLSFRSDIVYRALYFNTFRICTTSTNVRLRITYALTEFIRNSGIHSIRIFDFYTKMSTIKYSQWFIHPARNRLSQINQHTNQRYAVQLLNIIEWDTFTSESSVKLVHIRLYVHTHLLSITSGETLLCFCNTKNSDVAHKSSYYAATFLADLWPLQSSANRLRRCTLSQSCSHLYVNA